jgi:hypothetical protein
MDSGACYLALGLTIGIVIGAFFAHGNARRVNAKRKIEFLKAEKARAKDIMDKALARRKEGRGEMPGAFFLMLLAVVMLILTIWMLASADGLF